MGHSGKGDFREGAIKLDKNLIKVYYFHKAPRRYQDLSQHGGDEDFVVIGEPANFDLDNVAEKLTVCNKQVYDIEEDGKDVRVYITAHA